MVNPSIVLSIAYLMDIVPNGFTGVEIEKNNYYITQISSIYQMFNQDQVKQPSTYIQELWISYLGFFSRIIILPSMFLF